MITILADRADDDAWDFLAELIQQRRIRYSSSPEAALLHDRIDKYDFKMATVAFVRFLITFVRFDHLVLGEKEIEAKRPLPDTLREWLSMALSVPRSEEAASIARDVLLDIYKHKSLCKVVTSSLFEWVRSSFEEDDCLAARRRVDLLNSFVREAEHDADPEDEGLPRHDTYRHYIRLTIKSIGRDSIELHVPPSFTFGHLRKRIASRLKASWVVFPTGYETVIQATNYTIEDGSLIELTEVWPDENGSALMLPSLVLHSADCTNFFLTKLREVDEVISRSIFKLLQFLPTDRYTQEAFKNHNDLSTLLLETENPFRLRYFLRVLINMELAIPTLVLIDLLAKPIAPKLELFTLLNTNELDSSIDVSFIIPFLIDFMRLNQNKTAKFHLAIELMSKMSALSPQTVAECLVQQFHDISTNADNPEIWKHLSSLLEPVRARRELLEYCSARFQDSLFFARLWCRLVTQDITLVTEDEATQAFRAVLNMDSSAWDDGCKMIRARLAFRDVAVDIIDELLNHAFTNSNGRNVQSVLLDLVSTLIQNSPVHRAVASAKFSKFVELGTDRWPFVPPDFNKSAPFVGLRNLSATCFVNSILQQLFHLFPIRYLFMTHTFPEDSQLLSLQHLFLRMQYLHMPSADPEAFLRQWRGWHGELLDPRTPQDASEFFQALLETFPLEISSLFRGTSIDTLTGITAKELTAQRTDVFWHLSAQVKGFTNLQRSLQNFTKKDIVANYHYNGIPVTVRKQCHIAEPPPVLVIQLKRFDYDKRSSERYKINDPFAFPFSLDLHEILAHSEHVLYTLAGVVVHAGTAQCGHYTSYVRKGKLWCLFNDADVTLVDDIAMTNAASGRQERSSAYLLFYTRDSYVVNSFLRFDAGFDFSDKLDLTVVQADDQAITRLTALFHPCVSDLVLQLADVDIALLYLLKILCHSELHNKAAIIAQWISKCASSLTILEFFVAHFDEFKEVLMCCPFHQIYEAVRDLVTGAYAAAGGEAFALADRVRLSFPVACQACQVLPRFYELTYLFVRNSHSNRALAIERGWFDELQRYTVSLFAEDSSPQFLSSVDCSFLFRTLGLLVREIGQADCRALITHAIVSRMFQSPHHRTPFNRLVFDITDLGAIDFDEALEIRIRLCSQDAVFEFLMRALLRTKPEQFAAAVAKARFFEADVIDHLTLARARRILKQVLARAPAVLRPFLLHREELVRSKCELLFASAWPSTRAVGEMPIAPAQARPVSHDTAVRLLTNWPQFVVSAFDDLMDEVYRGITPQRESHRFLAIIRIWHFLAATVQAFTPRDRDAVKHLLGRLPWKPHKDHHAIALRRLAASFPSDAPTSPDLTDTEHLFEALPAPPYLPRLPRATHSAPSPYCVKPVPSPPASRCAGSFHLHHSLPWPDPPHWPELPNPPAAPDEPDFPHALSARHSPHLPHSPGAPATESDHAELWTPAFAATLRRVLSTDISTPEDREFALRVCASPDSAEPLLAALADSAPFAEMAGKAAKAILPRFPPARLGALAGHALMLYTRRLTSLHYHVVVAEIIARTAEGDDDRISSIQFNWTRLADCIIAHTRETMAFGLLICWCVQHSTAFETDFVAHFKEVRRCFRGLPVARKLTEAFLVCAFQRRAIELVLPLCKGSETADHCALEAVLPLIGADWGWIWPAVELLLFAFGGEKLATGIVRALGNEEIRKKMEPVMREMQQAIRAGKQVEHAHARLLRLVMTVKEDLVEHFCRRLRLGEIPLVYHFILVAHHLRDCMWKLQTRLAQKAPNGDCPHDPGLIAPSESV
jgi:ubiquitin C-terminal hydrolase